MDPFDCEVLGTVVPRQPVNAVSSLAFIGAAWLLWRRGHRIPAIAMGSAGIGSMLFHGAPAAASSWIHDIGLYVALVVAAVQVWRRIVDGRPPWAAGAVFVAGGVVWALSRTGGPLCAPESILQGHALWHVLAAVSFVMLFDGSGGHRRGAVAMSGEVL